MSRVRHLLTRNNSTKSIHTFLSNLANRQKPAIAFTSSVVGGNNYIMAQAVTHFNAIAVLYKHGVQ